MRMERKKLLGKQSYVSESESNNLSAGELCFCSFVFTKLCFCSLVFTKLSPLIYFFFHKEVKQSGEQGKMVVKSQG